MLGKIKVISIGILLIVAISAIPSERPEDGQAGADTASLAELVNEPEASQEVETAISATSVTNTSTTAAEEPDAPSPALSDPEFGPPPQGLSAVSTPGTTVDPTVPATTTTAPVVTTSAAPSTSAEVAPSITTSAAPPTTLVVAIEELALSRISIPWQEWFPEWEIDFVGPRSGIRALTYPGERRIDVFVRADDTADSIHRVLAHELGHVIDVEWNSEDERQAWRRQRGIPDSVPWWPSAAAPDFATGAGDFAEAFAVLETGVISRATVADQPDAEDLALLRELMNG